LTTSWKLSEYREIDVLYIDLDVWRHGFFLDKFARSLCLRIYIST